MQLRAMVMMIMALDKLLTSLTRYISFMLGSGYADEHPKFFKM